MKRVRNSRVVASIAVVGILLLLPLLLLPFGDAAPAAAATGGGTGGCTRSCGNIDIPYPFGVESGCYHAAGFDLTCDRSHRPPKLFLGGGAVQVLEISVPNATVRINSSSIMDFGVDDGGGGRRTVNTTWGVSFPYYLSEKTNMLLAEGCYIQVDLRGGVQNNLVGSCTAICPSDDKGSAIARSTACTGIGCCQIGIVLGYSHYNIQVHFLDSTLPSNSASIYMVDGVFSYSPGPPELFDIETTQAVTLDWVISNSTCPVDGPASECLSARSSCSYPATNAGHGGYICECVDGSQGNPYVLDGCQVIEPCEHVGGFTCYGTCQNFSGNLYCQCPKGTYGDPFTQDGCNKIKNSLVITDLSIELGVYGGIWLLILALGGPFVIRKLKSHKVRKTKEKFFKQNHGLLLQQLISRNVDIGGRMMITLEELEKATNNFDRARVIGSGGHGIVFKGILDLHVVAIKKSKIVVQKEISEFINEVVVLSQVNHRNVVKLLGCCLETEVPLLVYEYFARALARPWSL